MKRALLSVLLLLAACDTSKPKDQPKTDSSKLTPAVTQEPGTPAPGKTPPQPTPQPAPTLGVKVLPGFDLDALPEPRRNAFLAAVNETPSPCDRPETLAACVANKTECAECGYLARGAYRAARDLAEPPDANALGLYLEEMSTSLTAPQVTLDLSNVPKLGQGPVELVEFADFQCPHCAETSEKLDRMLPELNNKVTFYFKNFPLPSHNLAEPAARATLAAGRQGKFWEMHHLIFKRQSLITKDSFSTWATELGLDAAKFKTDFEDPALAAQVARDRKDGEAAKLEGTPTFFIDGRKYSDMITPEAIKDAIDFALAKRALGGSAPK